MCITCSNAKLPVSNGVDTGNNVRLFISPIDTITSSRLNINCRFLNENNVDVAILGRYDVTTMDASEFVWQAEIIYRKNGKHKISPFVLLGNLKLPTEDEYIIIKPGETKVFNLTFNFDKLEDKSEIIPTEFNNTDYGEYSLKLIYKDTYCRHDKAIEQQIESNTIKVTYKK